MAEQAAIRETDVLTVIRVGGAERRAMLKSCVRGANPILKGGSAAVTSAGSQKGG